MKRMRVGKSIIRIMACAMSVMLALPTCKGVAYADTKSYQPEEILDLRKVNVKSASTTGITLHIPGKWYQCSDIYEAVEMAENEKAKYATIILNEDVTISDRILEFDDVDNITLDLNGHSICDVETDEEIPTPMIHAYNVKTVIKDSSESKTGKIEQKSMKFIPPTEIGWAKYEYNDVSSMIHVGKNSELDLESGNFIFGPDDSWEKVYSLEKEIYWYDEADFAGLQRGIMIYANEGSTIHMGEGAYLKSCGDYLVKSKQDFYEEDTGSREEIYRKVKEGACSKVIWDGATADIYSYIGVSSPDITMKGGVIRFTDKDTLEVTDDLGNSITLQSDYVVTGYAALRGVNVALLGGDIIADKFNMISVVEDRYGDLLLDGTNICLNRIKTKDNLETGVLADSFNSAQFREGSIGITESVSNKDCGLIPIISYNPCGDSFPAAVISGGEYNGYGYDYADNQLPIFIFVGPVDIYGGSIKNGREYPKTYKGPYIFRQLDEKGSKNDNILAQNYKAIDPDTEEDLFENCEDPLYNNVKSMAVVYKGSVAAYANATALGVGPVYTGKEAVTASVSGDINDDEIQEYQWYEVIGDRVCAVDKATEKTLTIPADTKPGKHSYKVLIVGNDKETGDRVYLKSEPVEIEVAVRSVMVHATNSKFDDDTDTYKVNATYGLPVELPLYIAPREGYIFAGYNTKADGTGKIYDENTKLSETDFEGENYELFATWKGKEYKLTFDANGGTVSPDSKTVTFDSAIGELPIPVREGYTFKGWYTAKGNGEIVTSQTKYVTACDSTYYADWTETGYKLTFDANGGTVTPDSKTVTFTKEYGELPTPVREGYTFEGWYTKKSDEVEVTAQTMCDDIGDKYCYAVWKANNYSLTFDANGGIVTPDSKTVTFEAAIGELPIPVREGYTFEGWYVKDLDGVASSVTPETVYAMASDATYYAEWKALPPKTISYKPASGAKGNVVIPETVEVDGVSYAVTAIDKNAFRNNKKITSITIKANITKIGDGAFYGCTNLKKVTFSKKSSVESIGKQAFYGCGKLTSVNFSSDSKITSLGDQAFAKCTSLTKITVPKSVKTIGKKCFSGCKNLKTVTFASNSKLMKIGESAFEKTPKLTRIKITSKKLTKSGVKKAFTKASIKKVIVPSSKLKSYKKYLTKTNCGRTMTISKK